ncbi:MULTISPECIES: DUF3887 domain-containing protein [Pseudonocardia]|uniref:DUF3887 domain-containing protein n=1 Tax=Pseudonocardia TaxID=1847 RepID=UPI000E335F96|nr:MULTISPECIES: DUF3887 domain-containing protein [Pseudonocardia]BBG05350.1 hypothetical protein Pdca_65590 [Pseudonocardia autotrophica]
MKVTLTDAVSELRARSDALLAARVLTADGDPAGPIAHALDVRAAAEDVVRVVVQEARQAGATWQSIGDVLGVSRQAAFQRYGKPLDPRTGEPMNTAPLPGAAELAVATIEDLAAGRWPQVTARFDATMRDGLSEDSLAAAWAQIIGLSGAFEEHGAPEVVRAGDVTVTDTRLCMEAGDYTARISYRDDRSIAGLFIRPQETS